MPSVSVGGRADELYPESMRSVSRFALVAMPALASLLSCAVAPQTKRSQAVYDARERAARSYASADAIDLAKAIHHAVELGDYASNYAQLSSDVLAAQDALERSGDDRAPEQPVLLTWRGVLNEDVGRVTEAREDYQRSIEIKPTLFAAVRLLPIVGTLHDTEAVLATCKRVYPTLDAADPRLELVRACQKELVRLVPRDQTLAWLDPASAEWFGREMKRRDQLALQQQELRRQQQARAAKVAAYVQRCSAPCEDRGVGCQQRCSGDPTCNDRCQTTYNACVDSCEAAARKAIAPVTPGVPVTPGTTTPAPPATERRTDPSAPAASKA